MRSCEAADPPLHPWNRGFRWRRSARPLRRLSSEQALGFDESGCVVLEDVFDAATVERLLREIDPLEAELEAFLRKREGGRLFIAEADSITFVPHLVTRSPWLREFCSGPIFRDLAHDLVGPDVRLYWDQAVYKKCGRPRAFPWHQDNGYTFLRPQQYLTCWVALTDATPENGCPWVVPGWHRRGTLAHRLTGAGWQCLEDPAGARPLPVRAGGIAVFSSLTPHATGPNQSGAVRKSYIVQFAPEGAHALRGEPGAGEPVAEPQDAEDRQFRVLRGGRAVV